MDGYVKILACPQNKQKDSQKDGKILIDKIILIIFDILSNHSTDRGRRNFAALRPIKLSIFEIGSKKLIFTQ